MTSPDRLAQHLEAARGLTRVMDNLVRVPGTQMRFGLDPILSLVPGLGDAAGAALSGYLVFIASQCGAPVSIMLRMLLNVGIDMIVGVVPVLGDAMDFRLKANSRNLVLLERYLQEPHDTHRTSAWIVGIICILLIAMIVLIGVGATFALQALAALLGLPLW